jgi:hypothetical protein
VFPDEDDPTFDSPIDGLAGGLDTFVTSDYDYARHLKDLSLDTLSAGDKAESAYKPYLYSASCGKFMNTLLMLTLRKATSLESFRWNIRVELSRQVFKALHQINTLNKLHLRMQAGPSLYETPPPLPYTANSSTPAPTTHWSEMPPLAPSGPPLFGLPPPPVGTLTYTPPSGLPPPLPQQKAALNRKLARKTSASKEPPTLSGFNRLKSLTVLDIDNLDLITEIKTCVRNSSSTLTKLKISFSDTLASQSRKPPPDADPDDSDPDDEFQVVPMSQNSGYADDASGPAKAFRAQEERKSQESVLGRIFDVEPFVIKKPQQGQTPKGKEKETKKEPVADNPDESFVDSIKKVTEKLLAKVRGSDDLSNQEVLELIERAARTYVEAQAKKKETEKEANSDSNGESSTPGPASSATPVAEASGSVVPEAEDAATPSLFDSKVTKAKGIQQELKPEDIDIEQPIETDEVDDSTATDSKDNAIKEPSKDDDASSSSSSTSMKPTPTSSSTGAASPRLGKAIANLAAQKDNFETLVAKLNNYQQQANELCEEIQNMRDSGSSLDPSRIKEAEKQLQGFSQNIKDIQYEIHTVEAEIDDAEKQIPGKAREDDGTSLQISEYVRSTRGLALESLCIHLVPVRASILSRAVDLCVLKRLTLLNVGAQAPIWTLLAKENKVQPLALRKIFTDNVSTAFLNCVSQLPELHELFMLERSGKYKPESFAPKSTITAEQIRRLALRKHIGTLRKLMIKNDGGSSWDVDEKTMLLICNRGTKLEELAASMGIRAVVCRSHVVFPFENEC